MSGDDKGAQTTTTAAAVPTRAVPSMQDIMDEELARKMQEEENLSAIAAGVTDVVALGGTGAGVPAAPGAAAVPPCCTQGVDASTAEQLAADEELARQLQAEEQDHLLALRLQRELDLQPQDTAPAIPVDDYDYDDYEGDDYDDGYSGAGRDRDRPLGHAGSSSSTNGGNTSSASSKRKRNRKNRKAKAKAAATTATTAAGEGSTERDMRPLSETVVLGPTKHDPAVSARHNAAQLDRFLDGPGLAGAPRGPAVRALHEDDAAAVGEGGDVECDAVADRPYTALRERMRQGEARRVRQKERRAAGAAAPKADAVLDEAAELAILGLVNQGVLGAVHGVVSAGKEAHVYHAFAGDAVDGATGARVVPEGWECALKVFRAANEFRNRGAYLLPPAQEEYARAKQHARAGVRLWAQHELKNLQRLQRGGVRSPAPLGLYGDAVLVMQFVGRDGVPAPTLHAVDRRAVSRARWARVYRECALQTHRMFHAAALVHGDLSEYNILLWDGRPWIIDVSQALSVLHADALAFLRRDCAALTAFFAPLGIPTLPVDTLYAFVRGPGADDDAVAGGTYASSVPTPESYDPAAAEALFDELLKEVVGDDAASTAADAPAASAAADVATATETAQQ